MTKYTPGLYYVGDLCYIFKDEDWESLLEISGYFEGGDLVYDETQFFVSSTTHGDGAYFDQEDREYWVDSGGIGLWPVPKDFNCPRGGQLLYFEKEFHCLAIHESPTYGDITIGDIIIKTN
jgi:hypothetical protein